MAFDQTGSEQFSEPEVKSPILVSFKSFDDDDVITEITANDVINGNGLFSKFSLIFQSFSAICSSLLLVQQ